MDFFYESGWHLYGYFIDNINTEPYSDISKAIIALTFVCNIPSENLI